MLQSVPRPPRWRANDNAGKSEFSWEKHEMMRIAVKAQAAKANVAIRGRGIIVDMHAGDGYGVEHPQRRLFGLSSSDSSPAIACRVARQYGCDLVLCENNPTRMMALRHYFRNAAVFLDDHRELLAFDWASYAWAIVINDPNGPRDHGIDVLVGIAAVRGLASDFIVMVNDSALARIEGVRESADGDHDKPNGAMISGLRRKKTQYAGLRDPQHWQRILGKKCVAWTRFTTRGRGYRGRLLVLANSLANLHGEVFACAR